MRRAVPFLVVALVVLGFFAWKTRAFGLLGDAREDEVGPSASPDEVAGSGGLKGAGGPKAPDADPKVFEGDPVGRIDLKLGSAVVTGKVVGGGNPLRFARVVVVLAPPEEGHSVRTTKEGTFEFRGLPAGAVDLRCSADGFLSRTVTTPALSDGVTTDAGTVELKPRPPMSDGIEVKVTDPAGRPVAGAKVTASTLTYGLLLSLGAEKAGITGVVTKEVATDDSGVARIAPLSPDRYDVVVRAEGYALDAAESLVVASGRVEHIHIELKPGLSMSGIVVDRDGVGVPGAIVGGLLLPAFRSFEPATTDASGAFTMNGLLPGGYMLFAGSKDKGEGRGEGKAGDRAVRMELKGVGTLKGRVLLADGKPATKFTLRPYVEQPFMYVYSRQAQFDDSEGRFSLPLAPNTYNVDAKADGGGFTHTPNLSIAVDAVKDVTITLPAEGVVKGVVADPDGNHLSGAEVYVRKGGFPPTPSREQYVRADADGTFVLHALPLEPMSLYVRHAAWATKIVQATPAAADKAKEITIRMSAGARVEGHVTGTDGAPVVGERVNLSQGFEFLDAKSTLSDESGAYAFARIAAGVYNLSTGRFENGAAGQQKNNVKVGEEGTVTVDFTEAPKGGTGSVSGVVMVAGAPAKDASVYANDDRGMDAGVSAKTDAEGRYLVKGLNVGRITVTVEATGGLQTTKRVTLDKAGATATLDFTFGTCRVTGVVVGSDGKSTVSGAWMTLEIADIGSGTDAWQGVKGQAMSDNQGKFSWTGLDPGSYRVRIVGTGYAARRTDAFTIADGEAKDLGNVRLAAGGGISGRVTDEKGQALENVGVSLKDANGQSVFLFSFSSTGSDGRYSIQGVEFGAYAVQFEAKGFAPLSKPATVEGSGSVVDAVLLHGGSIAATVTDDRDKPVEGARIEIYDASGAKVMKTLSIVNLFDSDVSRTSSAGTATIPDVAPGTYTIRVTKDGMALMGEPPSVSVGSGSTATVRLILRAGP